MKDIAYLPYSVGFDYDRTPTFNVRSAASHVALCIHSWRLVGEPGEVELYVQAAVLGSLQIRLSLIQWFNPTQRYTRPKDRHIYHDITPVTHDVGCFDVKTIGVTHLENGGENFIWECWYRSTAIGDICVFQPNALLVLLFRHDGHLTLESLEHWSRGN